LHFEDVRKLLIVLHSLVEKGNTVLVIEHNLDVIKTADWIVDMGPEGGSGGGRVLVTGTPETVAAYKESHTGRFLAPLLAAQPAVAKSVATKGSPKAPATAKSPGSNSVAKKAPAKKPAAKKPAAKKTTTKKS
jgi:excinuclease ABC subunit A